MLPLHFYTQIIYHSINAVITRTSNVLIIVSSVSSGLLDKFAIYSLIQRSIVLNNGSEDG